MGCWNATCAMSRLPINYHDDVICWFIAESPFYEHPQSATNLTYPWDRYQLLGIPFRAKYNDYGSVEDINVKDLPIVEALLSTICDKMVEFELGDNEYHDIEVKKEKFNFELCMSAIHEERMQLRRYGQENGAPIGMMMIHLSVFEKFVNEYKWQEYGVPDSSDLDGKAGYFKMGFNLQTDAEDLLQRIANHRNPDWLISSEFREYLCMGDIYELMQGEDLDRFAYGAQQNKTLCRLASELRMTFGPQSGAGSQDNDYAPYNMLISAMQDVMKAYQDEHGEDEEYDE